MGVIQIIQIGDKDPEENIIGGNLDYNLGCVDENIKSYIDQVIDQVADESKKNML